VLYVLEREWGFEYEARKVITYERIDMVRPDNWSLLLDDLKTRTGLPITHIEIGRSTSCATRRRSPSITTRKT